MSHAMTATRKKVLLFSYCPCLKIDYLINELKEIKNVNTNMYLNGHLFIFGHFNTNFYLKIEIGQFIRVYPHSI